MGTREKRLTRRAAPARRVRREPRHEPRVREGIEQFRLAQETLGIVTWIWDLASGRVQWYGDGSRLLGLPPQGFSGRFEDYLKQVHPEDLGPLFGIDVECHLVQRTQIVGSGFENEPEIHVECELAVVLKVLRDRDRGPSLAPP